MSIFKKTSQEEVNAALGDVQDAPQAAPEAAPAPPPPAPARQSAKGGNRTQQAEDLLGECLDEFRALGKGRTLQKKIAAFLS